MTVQLFMCCRCSNTRIYGSGEHVPEQTRYWLWCVPCAAHTAHDFARLGAATWRPYVSRTGGRGA